MLTFGNSFKSYISLKSTVLRAMLVCLCMIKTDYLAILRVANVPFNWFIDFG